jgi:hypothetical protein
MGGPWRGPLERHVIVVKSFDEARQSPARVARGVLRGVNGRCAQRRTVNASPVHPDFPSEHEGAAMKTRRSPFSQVRHHRQMTAVHDDSYRRNEKPHEPTACPECGAAYLNGRWSWAAPPADAHVDLCPACQRIQDDLPGGYVTLKGDFVREHRDEILAVVHACETREKPEHPLQRIMGIANVAAGVEVATTDAHLARGIAGALQGAFKGRVSIRFAKDENFLRATWERAK